MGPYKHQQISLEPLAKVGRPAQRSSLAAHLAQRSPPSSSSCQTSTRATTHRKTGVCRVSKALDKTLETLGKHFVECHTRQRAAGMGFIGKGSIIECNQSGTRQTPISWTSACLGSSSPTRRRTARATMSILSASVVRVDETKRGPEDMIGADV